MVSAHADDLQRYNGIAFEVGNRGTQDMLIYTEAYAEALTRAGISHRFEVFEGGHTDKVRSRLQAVILPYLSQQLATPGPQGGRCQMSGARDRPGWEDRHRLPQRRLRTRERTPRKRIRPSGRRAHPRLTQPAPSSADRAFQERRLDTGARPAGWIVLLGTSINARASGAGRMTRRRPQPQRQVSMKGSRTSTPSIS